jgi:hypothetical protein
MAKEKIYYRKARNFSEILQAATQYIRINFAGLYRPLLFFAAPLLIAGSGISCYLTGNTNCFYNLLSYFDFLDGDALGFFFFSFGLFITGTGIHNMAVNKHVSENEASADSDMKVEDFKNNFSEEFRHLFFNLLAVFSILFVLKAFMTLFLGEKIQLSPYSSDPMAVLSIVFEILLYIVPAMLIIPLVTYFIIAGFFVCFRDRLNIFKAMEKVWYYGRDSLKKIWLLSFSALVINYLAILGVKFLVALVVMLPGIIKDGSFNNIFSFIDGAWIAFFGIIYTLTTFALAVFYHLCVVFQFTSTEEQKEGTGLKAIIENI